MKAQISLPDLSQEAEVSQRVGITDITIHYQRPFTRGRKIWGRVVPFGFNYLGFGTSRSAPWRAGADYNTTISFTHEVSIQGNKVPAGKYALFMAPEETGEVTIIDEDVLRFTVNSIDKDSSTEILTYSFNSVEPKSTTASLLWGTKEIPFKIDVDVEGIVMKGIRNDLRNPKGFQQSTWDAAAQYALSIGQSDQALEWVNASIEGNFFSKQTFNNISLKSRILQKQGKHEEANNMLEKAVSLGNAEDLYKLGLGLMANGQLDAAIEVMQENVKNNDGAFPSHYGLARAYSANKEFDKALQALEKSGPDTPEHFVPRFVKYKERLLNGEDINPNRI